MVFKGICRKNKCDGIHWKEKVFIERTSVTSLIDRQVDWRRVTSLIDGQVWRRLTSVTSLIDTQVSTKVCRPWHTSVDQSQCVSIDWHTSVDQSMSTKVCCHTCRPKSDVTLVDQSPTSHMSTKVRRKTSVTSLIHFHHNFQWLIAHKMIVALCFCLFPFFFSFFLLPFFFFLTINIWALMILGAHLLFFLLTLYDYTTTTQSL